jgi:hypothetical protein
MSPAGSARSPDLFEPFAGATLFSRKPFSMSTSTAKTEPARARRARAAAIPARRSSAPSTADLALATNVSEINTYLESLGLAVTPTVHINGRAFSTCLVTVDFGQPLTPVRLTSEQNGEFTERLRELAKRVLGRDANIRISHDGPNGVYWASVA